MFKFLFYKYSNYNFDKSFIVQYKVNNKELIVLMQFGRLDQFNITFSLKISVHIWKSFRFLLNLMYLMNLEKSKQIPVL